jgi:hypothetical protein
MKHVHVMDIRPDVITRTGVVQPYAIREIPPEAVARNSIAAFSTTARPAAPSVSQEIEPEEFAALAKRVAVAQAAGVRMPGATNPKLLKAAKMIRQGKPFVVKSAGREAFVKGSPKAKAGGLGAAGPFVKGAQPYRKTPPAIYRPGRGTALYQGSGNQRSLAPLDIRRAFG